MAAEAMAVLWEKMAAGEQVEFVLPFLFSVIRNKALHYLRRESLKYQIHGSIGSDASREIQFRINTLEACDPHALYAEDVQTILHKSLAEGMAQQLERLSTRRKDLDEAIGFCTVLEKASGNLEELDVEQTLARLAAREEQGVTFVNIERTDRKGERIRGACIGAALFVALMAFVIATMAWAFYSDPQEAPPLPLLIVLFGIPVGCIVGTLKVLLERIEEIGKGEEDAYRNY